MRYGECGLGEGGSGRGLEGRSVRAWEGLFFLKRGGLAMLGWSTRGTSVTCDGCSFRRGGSGRMWRGRGAYGAGSGGGGVGGLGVFSGGVKGRGRMRGGGREEERLRREE